MILKHPTIDIFVFVLVGWQDFCKEVPAMDEICTDSETQRFYYNIKSADCEAFTDNGCNIGIRNSFNDYMTCMSTCRTS